MDGLICQSYLGPAVGVVDRGDELAEESIQFGSLDVTVACYVEHLFFGFYFGKVINLEYTSQISKSTFSKF